MVDETAIFALPLSQNHALNYLIRPESLSGSGCSGKTGVLHSDLA